MRRVTVLTDFGGADGYVAAMKGVIARRAPAAVVDDAGHDVPRGDVEHAAWALARYWFAYPADTVHLVVVDPGVGTGRRAVALRADGRYGVGPDNGVFSRVLRRTTGPVETVVLPIPRDASATFHGRDVFAPAAAALAAGASLTEVGSPAPPPAVPPAAADGSGRVVVVDRFGNLITDVAGDALEGCAAVEAGGHRCRVVRTYADGGLGEPVALVGSDGTVEIAVRDGSAAAALGLGRGAAVRPAADT